MDTTLSATVSRVFLVDDAIDVRRRLACLIALIPGVEIAGQSAGVKRAFDNIVASRADVAVLDPCFSGKTDLLLLRALSRVRPSIVSIVLTNHCATAFRRACEAAGADFFFDKTSEFNLACHAIEAVAYVRRAQSVRPSGADHASCRSL
ncbi:response regulator receiver protein [Burkholderia sp. H160]|nr:response regulator receiver protein [Burkholderia sp. H160]